MAPPTDFVLLPVVDVGRAHVGGVVTAQDAAVVVHDACEVVDWRRLTARYAAHEVWAHVQRPVLNSRVTHDTDSKLNIIIYCNIKFELHLDCDTELYAVALNELYVHITCTMYRLRNIIITCIDYKME